MRSDAELASKIKVCEARIEDLGDRLRLGMGKLQAAVGESKFGRSAGPSVPLEEVSHMLLKTVFFSKPLNYNLGKIVNLMFFF
jgi:hypothetical protein